MTAPEVVGASSSASSSASVPSVDAATAPQLSVPFVDRRPLEVASPNVVGAAPSYEGATSRVQNQVDATTVVEDKLAMEAIKADIGNGNETFASITEAATFQKLAAEVSEPELLKVAAAGQLWRSPAGVLCRTPAIAQRPQEQRGCFTYCAVTEGQTEIVVPSQKVKPVSDYSWAAVPPREGGDRV